MAVRRLSRFLFSLFLRVNDTLVHVSGNERLSIACNKPWGAISITSASGGICLQPSSKSTGLNKLLVKYSAEQYFDKGCCQFDSGIDVLIHLEERSVGICIIL